MANDEPDWSRIPQLLAFIAEPAERYGLIQFDEQVDAFEATASESQRAELRQLARRLWEDRDGADGHALVDWVTKQNLTEHPEAARVEFLMVLLNRLGYC